MLKQNSLLIKKPTEKEIERKEDKMVGYKIYLIIATQKVGYAVDETLAISDRTDSLISKESLPGWMDFRTLYFFYFENFNDSSDYVKRIHVK